MTSESPTPPHTPPASEGAAWETLLARGAAVLAAGRGSGRLDPRREAEVLLREAVGRDAAAFLVERRRVASPAEASSFDDSVAARARGVPLQLLLGRAEFHEVTLRCEPGVFIPRPETETLVETALERLQARAARGETDAVVLDLCTGTGAVAIAIAAAAAAMTRAATAAAADPPPSPRVFAGDVDPSAVDLARRNAAANGLPDSAVDVRLSDLFDAFPDLVGGVDVLLANPPYVDPAAADSLPVEVRFGDPPRALFDPEGGVGFHRRIARGGRRFLRDGGLIALEIGDDQGAAACDILREAGYDEVRVIADLAGRDRVARGRWASSTRFS